MVSKESTIHVHQVSDTQSDFDIRITARISQTVDPLVDVSVGLQFDLDYSEDIKDKIYQRVRDGVHGGLAYNKSLVRGLVIDITQLDTSISLVGKQDRERFEDLLEALVAALIANLWYSIKPLVASKQQ